MERKVKYYFMFLLAAVLLSSGCIVRSYKVTRERVDQDASDGNRGYIKGESGETVDADKIDPRSLRVYEIELSSPVKFRDPEKEQMEEQKRASRNVQTRSSVLKELNQSKPPREEMRPVAVRAASGSEEPSLQEYLVKSDDTLQKISKKFYGTTKRWEEIYNANRETLKSPDRIYPGKVIYIPVRPSDSAMQQAADEEKGEENIK